MYTSVAPCPCQVAWPTQNTDRFCGYCGKSLVDYSLSWVDPPAIYLDDTSKKILQARIRNTGLSDVELNDLVSSQPGAVTIEYNKPAEPIKPNREHPFEVVVYPTLLDKQEIMIEAVVGPGLPKGRSALGYPYLRQSSGSILGQQKKILILSNSLIPTRSSPYLSALMSSAVPLFWKMFNVRKRASRLAILLKIAL